MKISGKVLLPVLLLCFFSGCGSGNLETGAKKTVSSFSESTIALKAPLSMELVADSSNIEVYTWDKNEIRFEQTRKVRGVQTKEYLEEALKDFHVDVRNKEGQIRFECQYKGPIKSDGDRSLDLRIHIPKKSVRMNYKLKTGTIKFFDDIQSDLNLEVNLGTVNINYLEGRLQLLGNTCGVVVENGKLKSPSMVKNKSGNISIRGGVQEKGDYSFETSVGNIELRLPQTSPISIESLGPIEKNEFAGSNFPTKIRVSTGMGKISALKY